MSCCFGKPRPAPAAEPAPLVPPPSSPSPTGPLQPGDRKPAPLPHPRDVLLFLANSPGDLERIYREVRQIHPFFPEHGSTLVLWRLLVLSGLPSPFDSIPGRMAERLFQLGARPLPPEIPPRAGDVFLTGEGEQITSLGVVARVPEGEQPETFWAVDHLLGESYQPYLRRITGDPDHPDVVHWLRPFG